MEEEYNRQEREYPRCPVCGEETDTFYRDPGGEVVGCGCCLEVEDAWEFLEWEREREGR